MFNILPAYGMDMGMDMTVITFMFAVFAAVTVFTALPYGARLCYALPSARAGLDGLGNANGLLDTTKSPPPPPTSSKEPLFGAYMPQKSRKTHWGYIFDPREKKRCNRVKNTIYGGVPNTPFPTNTHWRLCHQAAAWPPSLRPRNPQCASMPLKYHIHTGEPRSFPQPAMSDNAVGANCVRPFPFQTRESLFHK
jgi:hypothetical protein